MIDYELSEKLFLDIWMKHGKPTEITDKNQIYEILNDLIVESKHYIVLDHYSHINFDQIIKVEYDEKNNIYKLHWKDHSKYREDAKKGILSEIDELTWNMYGYCSHYYLALDINRIKFFKKGNHLFLLLQSNTINEKEMTKKIVGENEIISKDNYTDELYTEVIFFEGDEEDLIKTISIVSLLPYYVCVIQPKERIPSTSYSKNLLLLHTLMEIRQRLEKVYISIETETLDRDGIFSKGNTVRSILEYALKHFCVINNIPIDIEKKYGHLMLGELDKKISKHTKLKISSNIIRIANEVSHDCGQQYSVEDIKIFIENVCEFILEMQELIIKREDIN